jgi:hypothetical protein
MASVDEILKRSAIAREIIDKERPYIKRYAEIVKRTNPPPSKYVSTDRTQWAS